MPLPVPASNVALPDGLLAQCIRCWGCWQVYNNNGLPLWAAIGIPVGVIVVVALLLVAAKHQRARTERCAPTLFLWLLLSRTPLLFF